MTAEELCRRCGTKPGTERFYLPKPWQQSSLAGTQLKFSMKRTIGCDECWEKFSEIVKQAMGTYEKAQRNS